MSNGGSDSDRSVADAALDRLRRLVELESPSTDAARLRAIAGEVASALARAGAEVDTMDVDPGEHVIGRLAGTDPSLEPILILTHLDTVHPAGSFDPVFSVDGDRARGPGAFDMKGGVACVLEALSRAHPRRPVIFLATCDEETGSATSRSLIEELARGSRAVLVPEPPLPGGLAKTRRKGVAVYRVTARGRASHAGLAPEEGVNAVVELAHQVLAMGALEDTGAGTTLSVGRIAGGTATNVVPALAWADVDVRFTTAAEAERMDRAIRELGAHLAGADVSVEGAINRLPMERSPASVALFEAARLAAAEDGWELGEGLSGGASDGSFTAAMGIPTLDGLGPQGGGAHARTEHVLISDLPRRVHLFQRLLEEL
jgi:glutamate carboxypeptidase